MAEQANIIDYEEWRDIPGWEGLYQASSLGRMRSLSRTINAVSRWGTPQIYKREGIVLKPRLDRDGYLKCHLVDESRSKHYLVHQLVCLTFHGPPRSRDHVVAHGDGVRRNCRVENLRWATQRENHGDRRAHGTHPSGEKHGRSKLDEVKVMTIRREYSQGKTQASLAKEHNVSASLISHIVNRRLWNEVA